MVRNFMNQTLHFLIKALVVSHTCRFENLRCMCSKSNFNPKFHDFRWIEKWLRRWRNVYCGHSAQIGPSGIKTLTGPCQSTVRHLRSAQCSGSSRKSVLQSLQTDLECDAFNGSSSKLFKRSWWLLLMSLILFVQAFIQ